MNLVGCKLGRVLQFYHDHKADPLWLAHRNELRRKNRIEKRAGPDGDAIRAKERERYHKNPLVYKAKNKRSNDKRRFRKYQGLSREAFEAMLVKQNFMCPICGCDLCTSKGGPVVEHDHTNGHIRGLTCQLCNRGMGQLHDNPTLLRRAANYLQPFEIEPPY